MTDEEKHLWYDFLSSYKVKFYRQKVFGSFVLDFYCKQTALAVELDGNQHFTSDQAELHDLLRTDYLNHHGVEVVRFTNREVKENFRGVCETIDIIVNERLRKKVSPA